MDWNDIRYFLAVARRGGLTPAALELSASPATVSRRIDAFEQSVGATLFLRRQTGYLLTDEGERMLETALPLEQAMLGFERQTQSAAQPGQWSGSIRIASSEMAATYWIAPRLGEFLELHPGLRVELITGVEAVNLSRRDADIAVRMVPPTREEEGEYIAQRLGQMVFAAYASPRIMEGVENWQALPHISWPESLSHLSMAKWLSATFVKKDPVLVGNSMYVQHMAAAGGLGVAVLPILVGDGDDRLMRVESDHFACSRDIWLMFHRDLRASQRVIAVKNFLSAIF
jgi:DNA-binding transcriptional LysR family regulator